MNSATMLGWWLLSFTDPNWRSSGVGDFNGDGKPDILWRNPVTGAECRLVHEQHDHDSAPWLPSFTDQNWEVAGVGDFNAGRQARHPLEKPRDRPERRLVHERRDHDRHACPSTVTDKNWKVAGVGDFNGDGKPDILWRNTATGANGVWYMNGASMTGSAAISPVTDQNWRSPASVTSTPTAHPTSSGGIPRQARTASGT